MTEQEKRILKLSEQYRLSTSELIVCFDNGVNTIASEQQLIQALYGSRSPAEVDLKAQAYSSDNRLIVITAIANLYLKQAIVLQ